MVQYKFHTLILATFLSLYSCKAFSQEAFRINEITDSVFSVIKGKSFGKNCTTARSELRYLTILHYNNKGEVKRGALICNKKIANDLRNIFQELYKAHYPIERIELVDHYNADDETSMSANNTSCFNYRRTSNGGISKHGIGMAIDINPLYNPCIHLKGKLAGTVEPKNGRKYVKRNQKAASYPLIDKNDLCYKLFIAHGFRWGGAWGALKDYQHFEK